MFGLVIVRRCQAGDLFPKRGITFIIYISTLQISSIGFIL